MTSSLPTYQYSPDETEDLSSAIVHALSEAKGRDITEDGCVLYDSVDPEALDRLFRRDGDEDTVKVEFATHDAIVIIWVNGDVTIQVEDFEDDPNHG
jgi:hypothetical protein